MPIERHSTFTGTPRVPANTLALLSLLYYDMTLIFAVLLTTAVKSPPLIPAQCPGFGTLLRATSPRRTPLSFQGHFAVGLDGTYRT